MGRRQGSRTRLRHFANIALLAVCVVMLHDFTAPHGRGWGARTAIFAIDEYRAHISPRLRGTITCRFKPTCSAYGREAFRKYGFARGVFKTTWRIARCGPWTKMGTVDKP